MEVQKLKAALAAAVDRLAGRLTFSAQAHEYRLDGRVIPSVTQVLKEAGLIGQYAAGESWRAEMGTAVHRAAELDDENDLDEAALDPRLLPYLNQWREARKALRLEFLGLELTLADEVYGYGGTLDRVAVLGDTGRPAVIDLKTGTPERWAALQLAGYARFVPFDVDRLVIQLPHEGKFKVHKYEDPRDADIFLAAVTVTAWKRSGSRK
jgi:aryl carrier-like protein